MPRMVALSAWQSPPLVRMPILSMIRTFFPDASRYWIWATIAMLVDVL